LIALKRIYDDPSGSDGFRVLVDRLWPRGVEKERAELDMWFKDIAPSPELRKWYGHDAGKWNEFKRRYFEELRESGDKIGGLLEKAKNGTVTLLYAARDEEHNNAVVLKEFMKMKMD
jgi:uncharacterized protein YeaO (DUF488 family)